MVRIALFSAIGLTFYFIFKIDLQNVQLRPAGYSVLSRKVQTDRLINNLNEFKLPIVLRTDYYYVITYYLFCYSTLHYASTISLI